MNDLRGYSPPHFNTGYYTIKNDFYNVNQL